MRIAENFSPQESFEISPARLEKNEGGIGRVEKVNDTWHRLEHGECLSTYDERMSHVPRDDGTNGKWDGVRGESMYHPDDYDAKAALKERGLDGIKYHDAVPDFSPCAKETVEIPSMTSNRPKNFEQCDTICADQWNKAGVDGKTDWSARDVANWRRENGYSWHERIDRKHCDLVPTDIHENCRHLGGVSECKKAEKVGGIFDE